MRKLILLALALTLVGATLIALLYLGRNALTANPPIQFSDGSSLRLLEVTLGTNHIHGSVAAKLLNLLPQGLKQPLLKHLPNGGRLNTRRTSEPTLILWMEYSGQDASDRSQHGPS